MEEKQIRQIIAANIIDLMNDQGLSTTEVARKSNISQGAVSKIINAKMNITVPVVLGLAQGLQVDIKDVLKGIENNNSVKKNISRKMNELDKLSIGILSINNSRITCICNEDGEVVGTSDLQGGLDLAETTPSLIQLIKQSIFEAMPQLNTNDGQLRFNQLNLVTQSYEFEDTRMRFEYAIKKHFKSVMLFSDWQITYFADFQNKQGISLVTDKGVSLSYLENRVVKKLGGWKFPVYDLGGENWLGVETIRHTIRAAEGYIPMTGLARGVLAKFNGKIEKITETCFKGADADADVYCLFTELLLRSYYTQDSAAQEIIQKGFESIAESVERVDQIKGKTLKIALNGSLSVIYRNFFKKERLIKPSTVGEKAELLAKIHKGIQ